jgi:hypothetical protein
MILTGFAFGIGFAAALFVMAVPCVYVLVRLLGWLDS